jgi:hypothetical protein
MHEVSDRQLTLAGTEGHYAIGWDRLEIGPIFVKVIVKSTRELH